MKQDKNLDEIDEMLYQYFKNEIPDEIPNSTQKVIDKTFQKIKYTNVRTPINKVALIIVSIGIMTTGIIFAKDIEAYVKSLFSYSTEAVDSAVENGYVQSVENNFTYDQDIGIKVDSLVLDDFNLAVSISYETQKENIDSIWLERFTILNDNGDLIYEYEKPEEAKVGLAKSMERGEHPAKVTDTTFAESILFGLRQKETEFNKLHFEIRSVRLEHTDHTTESVEGNWKFDVAINDEMKKSENLYYSMVGNNEYVESCTGVLSATGMTIELIFKSPIVLDLYNSMEGIPSDYFNLKNGSKTFPISQYELAPNGDLTKVILYYNNVGKFNDNINEFKLYVPFYNLIIVLNQKSV